MLTPTISDKRTSKNDVKNSGEELQIKYQSLNKC